MKILLIEDEPKVAAFIKKGLEEQAFEVDLAYDGYYGKKLALENIYQLIILDIILPEISGLQVLKGIREQNNKIPVLMLTALGTIEDVVTGLDAGADDYLVKPFRFQELLARVRALTRRNKDVPMGTKYAIAGLEMDTATKSVKRENKSIILTAREFALLEFFMRNEGRVLTRADIAEKVWEVSFDTGTNIIDVYVNYLRNKIDKGFSPKLIHTLVGMGYVMRAEK
ncbi:MAG: response regulator transcription factor [Bacteroidetes bacterium]|nr:response regulator transcription factor [Bacteroidota bacterium]